MSRHFLLAMEDNDNTLRLQGSTKVIADLRELNASRFANQHVRSYRLILAHFVVFGPPLSFMKQVYSFPT